MSGPTILEYLNQRIRAETALAQAADTAAVRAIHEELANVYRDERHKHQVALSAKLQRRHPLRIPAAPLVTHASQGQEDR